MIKLADIIQRKTRTKPDEMKKIWFGSPWKKDAREIFDKLPLK